MSTNETIVNSRVGFALSFLMLKLVQTDFIVVVKSSKEESKKNMLQSNAYISFFLISYINRT